jgi:hypothetical protein
MSQIVGSESDKYKLVTFEHLLLRKDIDVNEHERLFPIILQHKLK